MGFSRPTQRHAVSVRVALNESHYKNTDANIEVFFNGTCETISSFEGPCILPTGRMDFWNYGTNVLTVDFDNDRVTDYGYTGHSATTSLNIREWKWNLCNIGFRHMRCFASGVYPFDWTRDAWPQNTPTERLWCVYYTTAPWIHRHLRQAWFDGKAYNPLAERRARATMAAMTDGLSWRWFTGAWVNGEWTQRFIDAEAEKRYNRWKRRTAT